MFAFLAKLIDWSIFQGVALRMPRGYAQNPRLEQALQLLNRPDFIATESHPARLDFETQKSGVRFRFPRPQPSRHAENNVVYGRLYRCTGEWQKRPVVVLLHGWADISYQTRFAWLARRCNRAGLNATSLMAPYHFQRRPRTTESTGHPDCFLLAEAASQAVAEIRSLTGWLLGEGCPAVALWGFSQGAWYAGMTVCRDPRLAVVVLAAPCARMNPWLEQVAISPRIRAQSQRGPRNMCEFECLNQTPLNLTLSQPAITPAKIVLIEGIYDLGIPKEDLEDLWQAWGQPNIWRLRHGHVTICSGVVPGLEKRVIRWLAQTLGSDS
jgi:pimeloyl-ACP methyl ester carboxylesterase